MSIRTFRIDVGIYNYSFIVCIGDRKKSIEFINETQELKNSDVYPINELLDYNGGVFTKDGKPTILWLPYIPKTPSDFSDLFHEIFHVVCRILKRVEIPLTESTEEAYCYLIGWITKQFWLEIKK